MGVCSFGIEIFVDLMSWFWGILFCKYDGCRVGNEGGSRGGSEGGCED